MRAEVSVTLERRVGDKERRPNGDFFTSHGPHVNRDIMAILYSHYIYAAFTSFAHPVFLCTRGLPQLSFYVFVLL